MSPSHSSTVLKFLLAFLLVCSLTPVLLASPQVPVTAAAPTFLIVPGAWHSPSHYNYLISHLKASGYNAVSSRNPSCNSTDPNAESVTKDADFIRKHVMTLLNSGQDVVLVMHSYGSIPASTAVKGLSKAERTAAGNLGGILGIICICGLLLQEGQSLKSSLPGDKYADWVVEKVCSAISVPHHCSRPFIFVPVSKNGHPHNHCQLARHHLPPSSYLPFSIISSTNLTPLTARRPTEYAHPP